MVGWAEPAKPNAARVGHSVPNLLLFFKRASIYGPTIAVYDLANFLSINELLNKGGCLFCHRLSPFLV